MIKFKITPKNPQIAMASSLQRAELLLSYTLTATTISEQK